jgi:hypothetical protein
VRRLLTLMVVLGAAQPIYAKEQKEQETSVGGFRMEGDPKIETVFGDSKQYKRYVDRFFEVYGEMRDARQSFSRNVQAVLASLEAQKLAAKSNARGRCPVDAIALSYSRAFRYGEDYHRLGKDLEASYTSINELDGLGETSGLTPDYRWKVSRAAKLWPQVLRDYKEMKLAFQEELAGELAAHGCDAADLVAKGDELEKSGEPETPAVADVHAKKDDTGKRGKDAAALPVPATTITFFIDNASCGNALKVYLDGTLEGEVGSHAKAAFQTLVGRHEMCLIPSTSKLDCGDQGTVRKTYIHDGWSIELRCD